MPMSEEAGKRPAKMSKLDKAAIFLLSLGESDAAAILKHMGPKEVQRVGSAMAGLRTVHREQVQEVMGDFIEVVSDQTSLGVGADGYIRSMLTQALGEDKANSLVDRILLGGRAAAAAAGVGTRRRERFRLHAARRPSGARTNRRWSAAGGRVHRPASHRGGMDPGAGGAISRA